MWGIKDSAAWEAAALATGGHVRGDMAEKIYKKWKRTPSDDGGPLVVYRRNQYSRDSLRERVPLTVRRCAARWPEMSTSDIVAMARLVVERGGSWPPDEDPNAAIFGDLEMTPAAHRAFEEEASQAPRLRRENGGT